MFFFCSGMSRNSCGKTHMARGERSLLKWFFHSQFVASWQGWMEGWAHLGSLLAGGSVWGLSLWHSQDEQTASMVGGLSRASVPREPGRGPMAFLTYPRAFSVISTIFCWLLASQEATYIQVEAKWTSPLDGDMARSHCRRACGMGDTVGTSSENRLLPH